ncbi:MAG: hypothetical protein V7756_02140 [Halopseudomonas sp.]|uniref:hypothetical protein n=1 Tax=Halopseudomonas sp. TaxID=2901191 RepID=UPI003003672B
MSKKHFYLVGYILDNDPGSVELELDKSSLSDEEAREYILSQHPEAEAGKVTDIRVTEIQHPGDESSDPGHNLQHADI